ncbi:hypothetical protein LF41_799 [Lysobacter dokdonensis DS-58]|uniref:Secreted protein n=1 Tax=Lysobacter dokdonensis DS-58 TaxID=1300345 RepID=A0A0A2WKC8_9GAMM|nr:hypothetical protein [Lysobacter dokdonensis]KGQ20263.1 hypothetical protein LF41_799 [Lysobacter dokdonensis DS-58]
MNARRLLCHGLFLLGLSSAATAAHAECQSLSLRNFQLQQVPAGTFESRNGEFSFTLPFKTQNLEFGSFDNKCLYAFNIDATDSTGHRSIEWIYLQGALSNDAFVDYWKGFIADYLAHNFGTGGYALTALDPFTTKDGRAGIRYAGTGTNNGGGAGEIRGVVLAFEERMANVYAIADAPIAAEAMDAQAESVEALAASITCTYSACRAKAPATH